MYVIGGYLYINGVWRPTPVCQVYDFENLKWNNIANLNYAHHIAIRLHIHNNKLICSSISLGKIYSEIYDPLCNSWTIVNCDELYNTMTTKYDKNSFIKYLAE
jgi:hypothetical protein